ncbi:hypothetical protein AAEP80_09635 [Curtobacterium sp. L3-7]|uniref:DUF3846 domain-containing protein n=1 Tax=Curtobacterium sp. L3-7 TaxID=3138787 RepID=UPI003B520FBC
MSDNYRDLGRDNSKEVGAMVKCIVIPHDEGRPPRLQEMPDIGAFPEAVDGGLEIIEAPGMNATMYVNEAAHRDFAPLNTRAMALAWLHAVDPMKHPLLFGDVVFSGLGIENDGDVPEELVRDVFEATTFLIDVRAHAGRLRLVTCAVRHGVRGGGLVHVADALRSTGRPVSDPSTRALLHLRSGDHLSSDRLVARGRRSSVSGRPRCSSHNIWPIATARPLPHN